MWLNGGFGLQQCVGQSDKESCVLCAHSVLCCYFLTVLFWLCLQHLHPPFSRGSTLWSGLLTGDAHTQTNSQTTHTSDHGVMSVLSWNQDFAFAKSNLFSLFFDVVCFIPKHRFFFSLLWCHVSCTDHLIVINKPTLSYKRHTPKCCWRLKQQLWIIYVFIVTFGHVAQ